MDVAAISQLIGSLGFPVAITIYLLWHQDKVDEQHTDEMSKITEALNNNTLALTKLTERMANRNDT